MFFNNFISLFLAIFYYTLGNLSPKYRSHNAAIQLVTVTKSSYLNKYGLQKVLKSFMESISILEKVKTRDYLL